MVDIVGMSLDFNLWNGLWRLAKIFRGHILFVGVLEWVFWDMVFCEHLKDWLNFVLQNLKSQGSLQMLKGRWEVLSPNIKNVIDEVGLQTFFWALLDHDINEYKDLQLLIALSERF